MATASPPFIRLWRDDGVCSAILSHLDSTSICSLRLANSELCSVTTSPLFIRTRLTLTPSALTRPSRVEALSRIGQHIEHLTFSMPHTPSTFLPPLLNPLTGMEFTFLYTPHTTVTDVKQRPKYGSPELGEILTQQYPPIFHAATNVPAFINAMTLMPYLRHLTISCPGQDPAQRYRRDAVDYALISLRIAIERAPLLHLSKLSLSNIHPSGLLYLRHMPGYGCTPSAGRRWKQIKKLNIVMDSWDFSGPRPGLDHLKVLDDYIRSFSNNLEKISFGWNGRKGPCPFALFKDPLFAPPRKMAKLFNEVTSPMSPLPAAPTRLPMVFPKLRYMQMRNSTMSSEQVSDFVYDHRHTVREFDFENVVLSQGGSWDDALAPLTRNSTMSEEWMSQQSGSDSGSLASSQSREDFCEADEELDEVIDTLSPGKYNPPVEKAVYAPIEEPAVTTKVKRKRVHRRRKRKATHPKQRPAEEPSKFPFTISAPIPLTIPIEEALRPIVHTPTLPEAQRYQGPLQPTVYTPKRNQGPLQPTVYAPISPGAQRTQGHMQPVVFDPNIQGVQRNAAVDAAQQELVDDPERRISTLKKAKEAVLMKLGKEFCKGQERKDHLKGYLKNTCSTGMKSKALLGKESTSALVPLMFSRY
ncbi:hypothetical protein BP5796_10978 [Coleophoma crateriformis]|uniref:F-box domain-containing protein n=1 Tax=Coleophoma crateriformis TaxID=565419 RepID=A0A3D8QLH2_9HELO|nr:hypothetical protein BP5796_10978 [Coleophoma crateriformis]